MRCIKTTVAAASAVLALTAATAQAQTVPPDRKTFVTFSGPVSVPGTTLPAGTYTFKLLDSNTDRHIVQIFDKEGVKLYTTLLAVAATRLEPTGDPVITFKEAPSNMPPAVHYWYYAGDLAGNELVYPKKQAQAIANASGEAVMGVDSDGASIDDWKAGSVSKVRPEASTAQADQNAQTASPSTASTTSSSTSPSSTTTTDTMKPQTAQPTTTAESTTPQPTTTAPMDQTARPSAPAPSAPTTVPTGRTTKPVGTSGRLPKTGSELPLVGLIGLMALGGALAFRAARTV